MIDCLRAAAALLVVIGHIRALVFVDYAASRHSAVDKAFYAVTGLGRQAVYLFFALSGFWVGGWVVRRLQAGDFSWRSHLVRRLSRLWTVLVPVLVLVLVVDLCGRWLFGDTPFYAGTYTFNGVAPRSDATHLSAQTFLGNVLFLQGSWVHTFGTDGPLWSLAYEFWYYLLFPLLATLILARSVGKAAGFAAAIALCGLAAGATALTLFPAWLLGVAAYAVARSQRDRLERLGARLRRWLQVAGFAAAVVACVVMHESGAPDWLSATAVSLVAACFLVVASVEGESRRARPLLGLGSRIAQFSYTLYAVHLPLLLFACAAIDRSGRQRALGADSVGFALLLLVGVTTCAWLISLSSERHTARVRLWLDGVTDRTRPSRERHQISVIDVD
jgi:peptidoglycan/LPS O-acetylase OafA/YrhL